MLTKGNMSMKKKLLLFLIPLILSGCMDNAMSEDKSVGNDVFKNQEYENIISDGDGGKKDDFKIIDKTLIEDINLDDSGYKNDSLSVTLYENTSEIGKSYAAMDIFLNGTHKYTEKFSGHKGYALVTYGDLLRTGKDAFVLHLRDYGSNYGSAEVYMYKVDEIEGEPTLVQELSFMDLGENEDSRKNPTSIFYRYKNQSITGGEIYYISELKQYGVKIDFFDRAFTPNIIICWLDNQWHIYREEIEEIDS